MIQRFVKRRALAAVALGVLVAASGFAQQAPANAQPLVLALEVTQAEFNEQANDMGWETGHVMNHEGQVSSTDYLPDVAVVSADGIVLFHVTQQAATRAIVLDELQLANYRRDSRQIEPLESFALTDEVPDYEPLDRSPVVLELTRERFVSAMRDAEWGVTFVQRSDSEVRDINRVDTVGVYSRDGYLLFNLDSASAERARTEGEIVFVNRTSDGFEFVATVPVQ